MKAAVLVGKGKFEIEDIPKPEPGPDQLLLKVLYCSICGTDIERVFHPVWDRAGPEALASMKGAILGHEYVGHVEAVGSGVTGFAVGDRVVNSHGPCGDCYYCLRGMGNLCMGGRVRGHPFDGTPSPDPNARRNGAMAEYIIRPAARTLKVPESISDKAAAMTEPLATGVISAQAAGIGIGHSVAVIGVGHIGLMVLAAARAAGAAPIIAIDRNPDRLVIAQEVGADHLFGELDQSVVDAAVELTGPGPDVAFVATSGQAPGILSQAFDMVRRRGRVMIVGMLAPEQLPTLTWMTKEVRVEGVLHVGQTMVPAISLLQHNRVNIDPVLEYVLPLEEAEKGFHLLHNQERIAVLLQP